MTKISELEERIDRMEKALIRALIMADPNVKIETQFPHMEKEKTVDPIPLPIDENDEIITQLPYKE
jgi:hypothetical protein